MTASVPRWLEMLFASPPADAQRLRWGFTNESWAVTIDGRRLVATRMADPGSAPQILDRAPELARRLAAAGVPTAVPIRAASRPDAGIVVTELIDGTPAIELLGSPDGPRLVGAVAGTAWARLRAVDSSGLELDDLWSRPEDLLTAGRGWLAASAERLRPATAAAVQDVLQEVRTLLDGRAPGFVHGDLVPVNLLVDDDEPAALLDLEAARMGEPLLDAAWFNWIVRYHHPTVQRDAWAGFAATGGIDPRDAATARLVALLPVVRILELLAAGASRPSRAARWLEQLEAWAAAH